MSTKKSTPRPHTPAATARIEQLDQRLTRLERRYAALEAWASTLINPETSAQSFTPPSEPEAE